MKNLFISACVGRVRELVGCRLASTESAGNAYVSPIHPLRGAQSNGSPLLPAASHFVERRIDAKAFDSARLMRLAAEIGGIESVQVVGNGVRVRYDVLRWDYQALTQAFQSAGLPVRRGWRHAFRTALFRFMDRNVRAHARAQGGACCSRPAGIYTDGDRKGDSR